ncbi:841_t:CDS:2 [Dentiscutata erythropus]|uniref:841_t:CDS:1 n=1 Tax=Dentiscutata erythropus TaxID=1348616 RepID=A0A9N8VH00_9GLOM|nr:841_t:CDS:2 [Dentiscutata erythropus]
MNTNILFVVFLLCFALIVEGLHITPNQNHLIRRNPQSPDNAAQTYSSDPYPTESNTNPEPTISDTQLQFTTLKSTPTYTQSEPTSTQSTSTNTESNSNPIPDASDSQTDLACYACWKGRRNKLPQCNNITDDQWNNFYNNPNDANCANCLCSFALNYTQISSYCKSDCSQDLDSQLSSQAKEYLTKYKCSSNGVSGVYTSNNVQSSSYMNNNSTATGNSTASNTTASSSSTSYIYYARSVEKVYSSCLLGQLEMTLKQYKSLNHF